MLWTAGGHGHMAQGHGASACRDSTFLGDGELRARIVLVGKSRGEDIATIRSRFIAPVHAQRSLQASTAPPRAPQPGTACQMPHPGGFHPTPGLPITFGRRALQQTPRLWQALGRRGVARDGRPRR